MFVQSNDWFIGPDEAGIALFNDDGTAITGDITHQIQLWDDGTEVNQESGLGADQPLQQAGPNTGVAENGVVQIVADGNGYPATTDTIRVTISVQ